MLNDDDALEQGNITFDPDTTQTRILDLNEDTEYRIAVRGMTELVVLAFWLIWRQGRSYEWRAP